MSWRSDLENRFTVRCFHCEAEIVDPGRRPGQRYIRHQPCTRCGQWHPRDSSSAVTGGGR